MKYKTPHCLQDRCSPHGFVHNEMTAADNSGVSAQRQGNPAALCRTGWPAFSHLQHILFPLPHSVSAKPKAASLTC